MKEESINNTHADAVKKESPFGIFKIIWEALKPFFCHKPSIIILSAIILIMAWGYHGNLDLLKLIIPDWSPPGVDTLTRTPILCWVPWDRELISFWGGAFLLVVIPALIIIFCFKQPLSMYGLGLPPKGKRMTGLVFFLSLVIVFAYPFYIASKNHGDNSMQSVYPFYKTFKDPGQFILYELSYFPFFLAIEFIFRGYLLFGLADNGFSSTDKNGITTTFSVGIYAVVISMLAYNVWHIGKPLTEMWSTPVWGLICGIGAYKLRSIWPVLMAHWLLNVFLDAMILSHIGHPVF